MRTYFILFRDSCGGVVITVLVLSPVAGCFVPKSGKTNANQYTIDYPMYK